GIYGTETLVDVIQDMLAFEILEFLHPALFHNETPHPEIPGPKHADVVFHARISPIPLHEMLITIQLTHQPGRKSLCDAGRVEGCLPALFTQPAFEPQKTAELIQTIATGFDPVLARLPGDDIVQRALKIFFQIE